VPEPDGASSKVTSSELPSVAVSSAGCVQRKVNSRGGSTASTVIGTAWARGLSPSAHTNSPVAPGVGWTSDSAYHHSRMCSGRLITPNTTSGGASMWTSRSMTAYSMGTSRYRNH
jgi:hypothetical protein